MNWHRPHTSDTHNTTRRTRRCDLASNRGIRSRQRPWRGEASKAPARREAGELDVYILKDWGSSICLRVAGPGVRPGAGPDYKLRQIEYNTMDWAVTKQEVKQGSQGRDDSESDASLCDRRHTIRQVLLIHQRSSWSRSRRSPGTPALSRAWRFLNYKLPLQYVRCSIGAAINIIQLVDSRLKVRRKARQDGW